MEQPQQPCALCNDPIDVGEAWMVADEEGAHEVAHSGCVYRDEEPDARQRWKAPDA
jgi:tRNA U34 2-thiouridine synthase MnmA/TrmU